MSNVDFPKGFRPLLSTDVPPQRVKPDLTYLTPDFLRGVAAVMQDGASKSGRVKDSWKDLSFEDALKRIASAYRHLMDIQDGDFLDKDSGLQNAYHLAANAMILAHHIDKFLNGKVVCDGNRSTD